MSELPMIPWKYAHPSSSGGVFGSPNPSRDDVTAFLVAHAEKLRRRVRGTIYQLERTRARGRPGAIDVDDILSTVFRRIDRAMLMGRLRTDQEGEFWAYVYAVAENAVLERLRKKSAAPVAIETIPALAPALLVEVKSVAASAFEDSHRDDLAKLLAAAPTEADRHLIALKLRGASYASISAATGRSQEALRTQWSKLCRFLRQRLSRPGKSGTAGPSPQPSAPASLADERKSAAALRVYRKPGSK